jgi:hypothetical protein
MSVIARLAAETPFGNLQYLDMKLPTLKLPGRYWILATAAFVIASTLPADATPTWAGIYGDVVRQSGDNPGTFSILTNDDYWGLHISLGIQVNGGSFTEYLMTYSGRKDNNSVWKFSPGAFPASANVKYYFHIWDNWGASLWDNNGGNNYSLTAGTPSPLVVSGDLKVSGAVRLLPRGNLSMGEFTNGPQP